MNSGVFSSVEEGVRVAVERMFNEGAGYQLFPPGTLAEFLKEGDLGGEGEECVDGEEFFKQMREENRQLGERYGVRLPPESAR